MEDRSGAGAGTGSGVGAAPAPAATPTGTGWGARGTGGPDWPAGDSGCSCGAAGADAEVSSPDLNVRDSHPMRANLPGSAAESCGRRCGASGVSMPQGGEGPVVPDLPLVEDGACARLRVRMAGPIHCGPGGPLVVTVGG
ncbi:hypothetical protein GCM10027039_11970 [Terrabacter koreensis]